MFECSLIGKAVCKSVLCTWMFVIWLVILHQFVTDSYIDLLFVECEHLWKRIDFLKQRQAGTKSFWLWMLSFPIDIFKCVFLQNIIAISHKIIIPSRATSTKLKHTVNFVYGSHHRNIALPLKFYPVLNNYISWDIEAKRQSLFKCKWIQRLFSTSSF